jgi:hypothetical protein
MKGGSSQARTPIGIELLLLKAQIEELRMAFAQSGGPSLLHFHGRLVNPMTSYRQGRSR